VNKRLEEFFKENGFSLIERKRFDLHGSTYLYYSSSVCKICLYENLREGEVNCFFAPTSAPNDVGNYEETGWQGIWSLDKEWSALSLEEKMARISKKHVPPRAQLDDISARLIRHYREIEALM
jgi:hypothetical protein